jgi:hypothetical protein
MAFKKIVRSDHNAGRAPFASSSSWVQTWFEPKPVSTPTQYIGGTISFADIERKHVAEQKRVKKELERLDRENDACFRDGIVTKTEWKGEKLPSWRLDGEAMEKVKGFKAGGNRVVNALEVLDELVVGVVVGEEDVVGEEEVDDDLYGA